MTRSAKADLRQRGFPTSEPSRPASASAGREPERGVSWKNIPKPFHDRVNPEDQELLSPALSSRCRCEEREFRPNVNLSAFCLCHPFSKPCESIPPKTARTRHFFHNSLIYSLVKTSANVNRSPLRSGNDPVTG